MLFAQDSFYEAVPRIQESIDNLKIKSRGFHRVVRKGVAVFSTTCVDRLEFHLDLLALPSRFRWTHALKTVDHVHNQSHLRSESEETYLLPSKFDHYRFFKSLRK